MVVIDDFIQDQKFLDAMAASDEFSAGPSRWWDGWKVVAAETLRQRLIQEIFGERCPSRIAKQLLPQAAGFEHWVGQFIGGSEANYQLRAHRDRDESHFVQTNTDKFPLIGAVFYPIDHQIEGGYLTIFNDDRDDGPFELIAPRFNRLVIFDASILHCIGPMTTGRRTAIAINMWAEPIVAVASGKIPRNG
jgi:hypothetical protein